MEKLRLARADEVARIFDLYRARVAWMNEAGIHQWNDTDYLNAYPLGYYEEMQKQKLLFVLAGGDRILGAVVLLPQDERWEGSAEKPAWYVHNLVTAVDAPGAGKTMLREAERLTRTHGMQAMRLDCAEDNEKLNVWYEAQEYVRCGACTDGPYRGVLREKAL